MNYISNSVSSYFKIQVRCIGVSHIFTFVNAFSLGLDLMRIKADEAKCYINVLMFFFFFLCVCVFVFLGVFDVHQSSVSPFTCGGINTLHGFLLLEAFHYALKEVNSKKGQFADILPGVNLGGIGIDACQSKIRGGYLVSNINNRFTTLARDGVVIDPSEIDAYIGSYGSRASIYLAQILNDLQIPQVLLSSVGQRNVIF